MSLFYNKHRTCGIYQITADDGRFYIGKSVNIRKRWKQHKNQLRSQTHNNALLQQIVDKQGVESLSFRVIFVCTEKGLYDAERQFIDELKPQLNLKNTDNKLPRTLRLRHRQRRREIRETRQARRAIEEDIATNDVPDWISVLLLPMENEISRLRKDIEDLRAKESKLKAEASKLREIIAMQTGQLTAFKKHHENNEPDELRVVLERKVAVLEYQLSQYQQAS